MLHKTFLTEAMMVHYTLYWRNILCGIALSSSQQWESFKCGIMFFFDRFKSKSFYYYSVESSFLNFREVLNHV